MSNSNKIITVKDLRQALEEFSDSDIIYTSRLGIDYDHTGVVLDVQRDNCSPYDHRWCVKIVIGE